MNPDLLREVVLVKAIEESDRVGDIISRKERERATRKARIANGLPETGPIDSITDEQLAKTISDRASILASPVVAKYPVFEDVFEGIRWPTLLLVLVLPLAFISGLGIRWISGLNRFNFMSAPVALLILWNLLIYIGLLGAWLFTFRRRGYQKKHFWRDRAARLINRRIAPLVSQTSKIDMTLGEAIARFVASWNIAAGPVIGQRLRQVAHTAAAIVAFGLIVGLQYGTWDKEFLGGWESSRTSATVKALSDLCLKPFTVIVDIDYPKSLQAFEALKFTSPDYASTPVLPWVYLVSLLLVATIILPRLVLTGLASLRIAIFERTNVLPEGLQGYARATLGLRGCEPPLTVAVFTYEIAVTLDLQKRLRGTVQDAFGGGAVPKLCGAVAVGNERSIANLIGEAANDCQGLVILTSIQSEPDDKHHGILLATAHDRLLSPALGIELKLLIDDLWSTPWGVPARLQRWRKSRRKRFWRRFARNYRVSATFIPVEEVPLGTNIQRDARVADTQT